MSVIFTLKLVTQFCLTTVSYSHKICRSLPSCMSATLICLFRIVLHFFFFFKLKVKVPLSKPLCQKSMVRYNNSAFIPETGTEGVQDNALDAGVLQTVLSPWTRRLSTENGELSRLLTCEV